MVLCYSSLSWLRQYSITCTYQNLLTKSLFCQEPERAWYFTLLWTSRLTCCCFMNVGRRHSTPRPEKKTLIHSTAGNKSINIFRLVPIAPKSHKGMTWLQLTSEYTEGYVTGEEPGPKVQGFLTSSNHCSQQQISQFPSPRGMLYCMAVTLWSPWPT